jgi:chromosome segregation ATPase
MNLGHPSTGEAVSRGRWRYSSEEIAAMRTGTSYFDTPARWLATVDQLTRERDVARRRVDEVEAELEMPRAEVSALKDQVGALREALDRIAKEHQSYDENGGGQYGIGVTDGHRCAATIARRALAPETK